MDLALDTLQTFPKLCASLLRPSPFGKTYHTHVIVVCSQSGCETADSIGRASSPDLFYQSKNASLGSVWVEVASCGLDNHEHSRQSRERRVSRRLLRYVFSKRGCYRPDAPYIH